MADEQIEQMSDEEYVNEGGCKCPYCHSEEVEGGGFNADFGGAWRQCTGEACGKEWTETFNLVGYTEADE